MNSIKEMIAKRVAKELKDSDVVNLGIGLPTLVPNYIPDDITIFLQSENGSIGVGPRPEEGSEDKYIINAGGQPSSILKGGAFFDSVASFGIIRGGHVGVTILGALEVDQEGNLANWIIPGKMIPGMGGAMDLVTGANRVIIAMEHTNKGRHKILKKCRLPLTAIGVVDMIITEMGVFQIEGKELILKERNPEFSLEKIMEATEAEFIVSNDLAEVE